MKLLSCSVALLAGSVPLMVPTAASANESFAAAAETQLGELKALTERKPAVFAGMTVNRDLRIVTLHHDWAYHPILVYSLLPQPALGFWQWFIFLKPVRHSLQELTAVMGSVKTGDPWAATLAPVYSSRYIDVERNVVVVGVTAMTPGLQELATATFGSTVELRVEDRIELTASRSNGSAPWIAGMNIEQYHPGFYVQCTTGFMVKSRTDGRQGLLTAGHCITPDHGLLGFPPNVAPPHVPIYQPADNEVVGYFGAEWEFDGDIDLGVIAEGNYEPNSFVGPVHPLIHANEFQIVRRPTFLVTGDRVCFSGAVTGEACDQEVTIEDKCVKPMNSDQDEICHVTEVISKGPAIVNRDGDSGGPVYESAGEGVIPHGIIVGKRSSPPASFFHQLRWVPSPWEIVFTPFE